MADGDQFEGQGGARRIAPDNSMPRSCLTPQLGLTILRPSEERNGRMLKIRLRRVGAKKQPAYRVVVAEASAPRDGRFVDIIGHYNPLTNPSTIVINAEKATKWLRQGAQPTERVAKLLTAAGVTGAKSPTAASPGAADGGAEADGAGVPPAE